MLTLTWKDWRFCLRWILATAIALGFCGFLGIPGLMVGPLVLAIAQGLALKGYWSCSIFWGFGTVVGGYTALVAMLGLILLTPAPISLMVFVGSAILGLAQAFVLRGVSRFWQWWPPITIAALLISIGWFVPLAINAGIYGTQRPEWQWIVIAAMTGLIGGALKSVALVWFLKQPTRLNRVR